MAPADLPESHRHRAIVGVVVFLGLYQGGVPFVGRAIFGADQRFAPALWLPSPWWWIACLGIVAATTTVVVLVPDSPSPQTMSGAERSLRDAGADDTSDRNGRDTNGTGGYDALSGLVLLVGIYNGVAPFIARLVFDGNLLLALPLRLAAPWWWLTSLAVIVTTVVLLAVIDNAKQHATGD